MRARCRFPRNKNLFCAFVGAGSQILCMAAFVFALALVGAFYPYNRGALTAALIVLYALTAGIAGFQAGSYYRCDALLPFSVCLCTVG